MIRNKPGCRWSILPCDAKYKINLLLPYTACCRYAYVLRERVKFTGICIGKSNTCKMSLPLFPQTSSHLWFWKKFPTYPPFQLGKTSPIFNWKTPCPYINPHFQLKKKFTHSHFQLKKKIHPPPLSIEKKNSPSPIFNWKKNHPTPFSNGKIPCPPSPRYMFQ